MIDLLFWIAFVLIVLIFIYEVFVEEKDDRE